MIPTVLVGLFMATLVVIHMAKPRFKPQLLSAARFFKGAQSTQRSNRRLSLGNPLRSLPLYIQFPLLALALATLHSTRQTYAEQEASTVGLWVVLDTSASMSTMQADSDRMSAARKAVQELVYRAQSFSSNSEVCARLSAFDLELREIQPSTRDLGQLLRAAEQLETRALGTDLTLVQRLLSQEPDSDTLQEQALSSQQGFACAITHIAVVSDQPAPQWAAAVYPAQVIWLDIGLPVPNAGITGLGFTRDPLTGQVSQISLDLEAYGEEVLAPQVQVLSPAGQVIFDSQAQWSEGGRWQATFEPQAAGLYTVQLLSTDAYAHDNQATLDVTTGKELLVDWQLPDHSLLEQLPWQASASDADFRVAPAGSQVNDTVPTLIVGSGYRGYGEIEEILYFVQGHPLLKDLNLDVAEQIGIQGTPTLEGFEVVLMGAQNRAWIAERLDPPAVYVPGLPRGEDPLWSFSLTVFFNGVRRLLQTAPLPPLYTLTSSQLPEPSGSRIALHPGEGNTAQSPFSLGAIEDLQPSDRMIERNPVWPLGLSGLIIIFLVERLLFGFGSSRWR